MDFKELQKRVETMPIYPDTRFPPSKYYRFLELLAMEIKPKLSVVAGVSGGGCVLHLAKGHTGHVIGIDIAWDMGENIEYIKDNFPNFEFILNDSISIANLMSKDKAEIDILFLDTVHTYEATKNEFTAFLPCLKKGSVVCFDDLFRPGMQDFWDELEYPKVRLDDLHQGGSPTDGGWGVCEIT